MVKEGKTKTGQYIPYKYNEINYKRENKYYW
jgi:hypothetical protein